MIKKELIPKELIETLKQVNWRVRNIVLTARAVEVAAKNTALYLPEVIAKRQKNRNFYERALCKALELPYTEGQYPEDHETLEEAVMVLIAELMRKQELDNSDHTNISACAQVIIRVCKEYGLALEKLCSPICTEKDRAEALAMCLKWCKEAKCLYGFKKDVILKFIKAGVEGVTVLDCKEQYKGKVYRSFNWFGYRTYVAFEAEKTEYSSLCERTQPFYSKGNTEFVSKQSCEQAVEILKAYLDCLPVKSGGENEDGCSEECDYDSDPVDNFSSDLAKAEKHTDNSANDFTDAEVSLEKREEMELEEVLDNNNTVDDMETGF